MYFVWTFTNTQNILVGKFYGLWDEVCSSLCMWLAFICILLPLHCVCHDLFFNYLMMLRRIQVALSSQQHYLLSSCPQQTPWCKLQGTAHGHIPLPKRQYQQVCYWQPMDRQNLPKIKRTCSKIHNYHYPLTRHRELKIVADWGAYMKQKTNLKRKYICVC
jgi:hypothetical protein